MVHSRKRQYIATYIIADLIQHYKAATNQDTRNLLNLLSCEILSDRSMIAESRHRHPRLYRTGSKQTAVLKEGLLKSPKELHLPHSNLVVCIMHDYSIGGYQSRDDLRRNIIEIPGLFLNAKGKDLTVHLLEKEKAQELATMIRRGYIQEHSHGGMYTGRLIIWNTEMFRGKNCEDPVREVKF